MLLVFCGDINEQSYQEFYQCFNRIDDLFLSDGNIEDPKEKIELFLKGTSLLRNMLHEMINGFYRGKINCINSPAQIEKIHNAIEEKFKKYTNVAIKNPVLADFALLIFADLVQGIEDLYHQKFFKHTNISEGSIELIAKVGLEVAKNPVLYEMYKNELYQFYIFLLTIDKKDKKHISSQFIEQLEKQVDFQNRRFTAIQNNIVMLSTGLYGEEKSQKGFDRAFEVFKRSLSMQLLPAKEIIHLTTSIAKGIARLESDKIAYFQKAFQFITEIKVEDPLLSKKIKVCNISNLLDSIQKPTENYFDVLKYLNNYFDQTAFYFRILFSIKNLFQDDSIQDLGELKEYLKTSSSMPTPNLLDEMAKDFEPQGVNNGIDKSSVLNGLSFFSLEETDASEPSENSLDLNAQNLINLFGNCNNQVYYRYLEFVECYVEKICELVTTANNLQTKWPNPEDTASKIISLFNLQDSANNEENCRMRSTFTITCIKMLAHLPLLSNAKFSESYLLLTKAIELKIFENSKAELIDLVQFLLDSRKLLIKTEKNRMDEYKQLISLLVQLKKN